MPESQLHINLVMFLFKLLLDITGAFERVMKCIKRPTIRASACESLSYSQTE